MRLFCYGAGLLVLSFLVHIIVWRVHLPRRQIKALLVIFTLVPVAALLGVQYAGSPTLGMFSAPDVFRLVLFYLSFSLVYICIYSAIEIPSPTLTIVSFLARPRPSGCSEQQVADLLIQTDDLNTRIRAMISGGMIALNDGRYRLTPKGRRIARLFEFASLIFGLPLGG